jgi:hypothetical protein
MLRQGQVMGIELGVAVKNTRMSLYLTHVARMGEGEAYTGFQWGNMRERDYWEVPGIDGRIILK